MSGLLASFDINKFLGQPAGGAAVAQGTAGTATRKYKLVFVDDADDPVDNGAPSAEFTDATGVDAFTVTDFERLTWTPREFPTQIWRTDSVDAVKGLIGTVAAGVGTFDDLGEDGDGNDPPAAASTTNGIGDALSVIDLHDKYIQFDAGGGGTVQMQGTINGTEWVSEGAAISADGIVAVLPTYSLMRAKMTALTADANPTVKIAGHRIYG